MKYIVERHRGSIGVKSAVGLGTTFIVSLPLKNQDTGLGLVVCKSIVERHRGSIGVKSAVGQGTTFIVSLPLKAPQDSVKRDSGGK